MKCFMHQNEEARCICVECGKAMCIDCSAETKHSGKCPNCLLDYYIKQRNKFTRLGFVWGLILWAIFGVLCALGSILYNLDEPIRSIYTIAFVVNLLIALVVPILIWIHAGQYQETIEELRKSKKQGTPFSKM